MQTKRYDLQLDLHLFIYSKYIYKTAFTVAATIDPPVCVIVDAILLLLSFLLIHSFLFMKNNIINTGN